MQFFTITPHRSLHCSYFASDAATGTTIEYSYYEAGITYSYTPELRGGSFNPDRRQIEPAWTEFWAASVAMIEAIEQELSTTGPSATSHTSVPSTTVQPTSAPVHTEQASTSAAVSGTTEPQTTEDAGILAAINGTAEAQTAEEVEMIALTGAWGIHREISVSFGCRTKVEYHIMTSIFLLYASIEQF